MPPFGTISKHLIPAEFEVKHGHLSQQDNRLLLIKRRDKGLLLKMFSLKQCFTTV